MMQLSWQEIISVTSGSLFSGSIQGCPTGFSINTRTLKRGDVFVALPGEKTDGHNFIDSAFNKGASGAIIKEGSTNFAAVSANDSVKLLISVKDPQAALQQCAAYYRNKFAGTLIAVTGSSGKTTTKDLTAAVLNQRFPTMKTSGNYNNQLGLPLVLLNLENYHEAAVLEMGMSSLGEIALLTKIARPSIGVITNIGTAHMELLGSQDAIASAKGELLQGLTGRRLAVLNGDDIRQRRLAEKFTGEVLFYGINNQCDLQADNISCSSQGVEFSISGKNDRYSIPLPGMHNVYNGLAAAAVGFSLGLTEQQIQQGLSAPPLSGMRMEIIPFGEGTLINDAYNANPESAKAALSVLKDFRAPKIAVLGDMLELGGSAAGAHRQIGTEAVRQGVDYLVLLGKMAVNYREGALTAGMPPEKIVIVPDHDAAVSALLNISFISSAVILIKGSRGMMMEKIAAGFLQSIGRRKNDEL